MVYRSVVGRGSSLFSSAKLEGDKEGDSKSSGLSHVQELSVHDQLHDFTPR